MKIESKKHEIVRPKLPSPSGSFLPLSIFDQIACSNYINFVLFFAPSQNEQLSLERLKKSLSRALLTFSPLAGRYVLLPDDAGLEVECNDKGVEFFEAYLPEKLEQFHESRCQVLCPCPEFPTKVITEVPLLLVQTTRFQCGGWSLAVAMHHNVGDGAAMSLFMKTWSSFASGSHHPVQPPCFDRAFFDSTKIPQALKFNQDYSCLLPVSPQLQPCVFRFTSSQLQALKDKCIGNYTRFQVLAAHIWKEYTKLRKNTLKETKLMIPLDGRSRIAALPKDYFGNATFAALAVAKVDELIEQPLSFAAETLRQAIQQVSAESMETFLKWIQQQHRLDMLPSMRAEPLVITSWAYFPLYDLDFGCGKPVLATSPGVRLAETIVFLPWSRDGTMTVVIQLRDNEMANLLANPEFLAEIHIP